MSALWILILVGLIALNAFASYKTLTMPTLTRFQRAGQFAIIWLIPLIGSVICISFVNSDDNFSNQQLNRNEFIDSAGADSDPSLYLPKIDHH